MNNNPFKCNIKSIIKKQSMTLFMDSKDIEFEIFLKYTIIQLKGKIKKPKTRKKKIKLNNMKQKQQAMLIFLQMINQSSQDKDKLQKMFAKMLKNNNIKKSQIKSIYSNQLPVIIEQQNDHYNSRLENKKDNHKKLIGKRDCELFDNNSN